VYHTFGAPEEVRVQLLFLRWKKGEIVDLRILHRISGAKSSNQRLLSFLRLGGRGRGMGVFAYKSKFGIDVRYFGSISFV
jgi:hypothetical protein